MLQNWDVSRIEASQHLSQGRKRPFTGSLVMGCPCGSNTPQREATVLRRISTSIISLAVGGVILRPHYKPVGGRKQEGIPVKLQARAAATQRRRTTLYAESGEGSSCAP